MTWDELLQRILWALAGTFATEHQRLMWIAGLSAVVALVVMLPTIMQSMAEDESR